MRSDLPRLPYDRLPFAVPDKVLLLQSGGASRHSSLTKSNELSPIELARRQAARGPAQPEQANSEQEQEQDWTGKPLRITARRQRGSRGHHSGSADRAQPAKPARRRRQARGRRSLQAPRELADPLDSYTHQAALRQRCNAASAALLSGKASEARALHVQAPLDQLRQLQPPRRQAPHRPPVHTRAAASGLAGNSVGPEQPQPAAQASAQQHEDLEAQSPHDADGDEQALPDHEPAAHQLPGKASLPGPSEAKQDSDRDTGSLDHAMQQERPHYQQALPVRTHAATAELSTRARNLLGLRQAQPAAPQVRIASGRCLLAHAYCRR